MWVDVEDDVDAVAPGRDRLAHGSYERLASRYALTIAAITDTEAKPVTACSARQTRLDQITRGGQYAVGALAEPDPLEECERVVIALGSCPPSASAVGSDDVVSRVRASDRAVVRETSAVRCAPVDVGGRHPKVGRHQPEVPRTPDNTGGASDA